MTTTKITELTPSEQEAHDAYHAECLEYGRSTKPADRPRAEAAITKLYHYLGKPSPRIIWVDSPLAGQQLQVVMRMEQAGEVPTTEDELSAAIKKHSTNIVWPWFGQYASWFAYLGFHHQHIEGFSYAAEDWDKLSCWLDIFKSCGLWWSFDGLAIVSERPVQLHVDDRGRLHNDSGAAMLFRDNFALYQIHGVTVPADVVENPASITVERILGEENAEVRRVMIDKYGVARFARDADATTLDDNPTWGRLISIPLGDDEPLVMVDVLNNTCETCQGSTGEATASAPAGVIRCVCDESERKPYLLRVPPSTRSTLEGLAWMAGVTADEYAREVAAQA